MAVYLLHSNKPLGTVGRGAASHYIGYSEDENLWQRLSEHANPRKHTSKIVTAFHAVGATLRLVRVWPQGGRALERYLKSLGKYKSRCPVCQKWIPESEFLSLETIRSMTLTSGARLSSVPTLVASGRTPSGIPSGNSGVSLAQPILNGPTEFGGAVVILSAPATGGTPTSVTAKPSDRVSASAGTRQRRSSGASTI